LPLYCSTTLKLLLYKHPYDDELKQVADGFAKLLRPMIETVDHYGLKKYHLKKHLSSVDEYYKKHSTVF